MNTQFETTTSLVASVETLISLPEVYLQVKAVVEDPDSGLSDLADAVSIDPGIAARILRLVNSAYFCLGVTVDNIRQAVNLLGMKSVHNLVLATALSSRFSRSSSSDLDMRSFWESSVRCAVFARSIAISCDEKEHERLFIDGLLCNIGHQVMYMQMAEQTKSALNKSVISGEALANVESELLGFNYAEVGGELLKQWGMPESITEVVRHHIDPENSSLFSRDASIVHIANVLSQLTDNPLANEIRIAEISPLAWQITGLNPDNLLELFGETTDEMNETIDMLLGSRMAA